MVEVENVCEKSEKHACVCGLLIFFCLIVILGGKGSGGFHCCGDSGPYW